MLRWAGKFLRDWRRLLRLVRGGKMRMIGARVWGKEKFRDWDCKNLWLNEDSRHLLFIV